MEQPIKNTTVNKYNLVLAVLQEHPETRECNAKLLSKCYLKDHSLYVLQWNFEKMIHYWQEGLLTQPDTYLRHARAIRAKYPELRGTNHAANKALADVVAVEQKLLLNIRDLQITSNMSDSDKLTIKNAPKIKGYEIESEKDGQIIYKPKR